MASQPGYKDTGSSGRGVSWSKQLGSRDLPSKRLLGTGVASVVYETEVDGKKSARKDFIGVPSGTFEKEAVVLEGLKDHINVVKTRGWTVNKVSCSLVLEYVDDDLMDLLLKRKQSLEVSPEDGINSGNQSDRTRTSPPFELDEALDIMEQIARAMEFLHDQGIPHGDLKTRNILVTRGDQNSVLAKVADFGLVRTKRKSISFASRQARKLDMARWTAPEILEVLLEKDKGETSSDSGSSDHEEECAGSSGVTKRGVLDGQKYADIYSFAVICCQILTGEDPYPNSNWRELMDSIVTGELRPTLPAACPQPLSVLLKQCWAHRRGAQATFTSRPPFNFISWRLENIRRTLLIPKFDYYSSFPSHSAMIVMDSIEFLVEETMKSVRSDAECKNLKQKIELIYGDVLIIYHESWNFGHGKERVKFWIQAMVNVLAPRSTPHKMDHDLISRKSSEERKETKELPEQRTNLLSPDRGKYSSAAFELQDLFPSRQKMGDVEEDEEIQSLSKDGVNEEESFPDVDCRTAPARVFDEICDWKECLIPFPGDPSSTEPQLQTSEGRGISSPYSVGTDRLWDPDPFYPYMHCLSGSQSTSTTSGECSTHQVEIPVWRALVRSDAGLEYRLGGSLNDNNLNQAMNYNSSEALGILKQRRSEIISSGNNHDFLLAWLDLALAQLYQSMGGDEMLKEAMNMRKEVLDCVLPLQSSRELLVRVCKTYYYTSQYEWGAASMTSEAMNEAKQEYAKLMRCNEWEAEAQLCFLLCVDHEYFGNSEESLRWVQESNWRREMHSLDAGRNCMLYFLGYEAKLLMKQGKYEDAVSLLMKLNDTNERDDVESPKHAVNIHKMLEECYMEMSRRTDEGGLRIDFEQRAELHACLQLSLGGVKEDSLVLTGATNRFSEIPCSLRQRTPSPLGSSLGLVHADKDSNGTKFLMEAMEKFPEPITSSLHNCLKGLVNAADDAGECSYQQKILICEQFRELLKISKNVVDEKTYDWLLSWIDLSLANLYQYRAGKLEMATLLRKEMRQCAEHQLGSDLAFLIDGYDIMFDAASSQKRVVETDPNLGIESDDTVRRPVESRVKSLFWLFYGHMEFENWDPALKLLREARRLKEELCIQEGHDCAKANCSTDYFSSDLDYFRCEAVLLLELGKFDEADVALKNLINTKHVREGSERIVFEAKVMLMGLRLSRGGALSSDLDEEQRAVLQFALDHRDNKNEDIIFKEYLPSTGIIIGYSHELLGFGSQCKLIQCPVGLEHYLNRDFPLQCSMAFRKHANEGRSHLERGEWDKAIFNFEWCIELLMKVQSPKNEDACNWLVVWASLPLANIYQFKRKNFKRALDVWRQMEMRIPQSEDSTSELYRLNNIVRTTVWTQEYQYVVSDLKDTYLKNLVVKEVYEETSLFQDVNAAENYLLMELSYVHIHNGCYGDALNFIEEAKQHLSRRDYEQGMRNVLMEAFCYSRLGMYVEAYEVLKTYRYSELKQDRIVRDTSLYVQFRHMEKAKYFESNSISFGSDFDMSDIIEYFSTKYEDPFRKELRADVIKNMSGLRDKLPGDFTKSLKEAIQRYEELSMVEKIGNKGDLTDNYQILEFDYMEYYMLAKCCELLCLHTISSVEYLDYEQVKEYQESMNFKRTVTYLEKFVEVSPDAYKAENIAQSKAMMTKLCAALETKYYAYISLFRLGQILSLNDVSQQEQRALLWRNTRNELHAYLDSTQKVPPLVQRYGKEAVNAYAHLLRNVGNSRFSDANWLKLLKDHEVLYSTLQDYHCRRAGMYELLCTGFGYKDSDGEIEKQINICRWNAFMYAEGERSRSLLFQLRNSNKLSSSDEWGFDVSNDSTLKAIEQYCTTLLKGDAIFVQYSRVLERECAFKIYIIDQDGKLSVKECDMDRGEEESTSSRTPRKRKLNILEDKLAALYEYFGERKRTSKNKEYINNSLREDLEFLYDKLIRPFAAQVQRIQEKPHHKIILAPTELLTKIPFAALRDKVTGKYLIESHTISVTPSLSVLQVCTERLQELRSSPPYKLGLGSIVALGDPACGTCRECRLFMPLHGTGQEVEYIAELFGKTAPDHVVKLLRENATAKQLLHWAVQPSRASGFRQAIVHIGTPATIDENDQRKNELRMACANLPRSDRASNSRSERVQHEDYCSDYQDHGSDSGVSNRCIEPMETMMAMHAGTGLPTSSGLRENSHHLMASQISSSEWKWRAELVVLSGSRTLRGRVTTEGVLSIARSFMIAGVPCVVASLSIIPDKATYELMRVFYKKLQEGEDVASALRSAMCALIEKHREVREWALFYVLGVPTLCIPNGLQQK